MRLCMRTGCLFFSILLVTACSRNIYSDTNKDYKKQAKLYAKLLRQYPVKDSAGLPFAAEWVGTTNFTMRRPNYVIIHHTAQNSCDQTLKTFTIPRTQVSSHYVICKEGTIYHMLNDYLRGHHAGVSRWGNNTDLNSSSVGIEIDNNGFEEFTEAQINSLLQLLGRLKRSYGIPQSNFLGHGDIAPTRKVDPNWRFPWKLLSENGFGLWWNDTTGVEIPTSFNHIVALRIVGYDIKDSSAAIRAFKQHFIQDTTNIMIESDRKILYQLMKQYL